MAFSKATETRYEWDEGDISQASDGASDNTMVENPDALTVSQALTLAKRSLESLSVTIMGEISECSNQTGYKAVYFTVSDQDAALPCLMWLSLYQRTGVELRKGLLVEITGRFSLYAAKGRMNFDVKSLKLAGEGDLRIKVAQLARKIQAEGLMDNARKKLLPEYPTRVAVVTSPRGKAIHDVIRTLRRRFPLSEVLVAGVPVEGADAPGHIIEGLSAAIHARADVILLVRGGGSYEDLMPFNDENLVRFVAASPIPIITGIGHEPDNSIVDMVADHRASTPTAAAEAATPDISSLDARLTNLAHQADAALEHRMNYLSNMVAAFTSRALFIDPAPVLFSGSALNLDQARLRLSRAIPDALARDKEHISLLGGRIRSQAPHLLDRQMVAVRMNAARLQDLSPLNILSRGYAIAYDHNGSVLKQAATAARGDNVRVRLSDGAVDCTVSNVFLEDPL
jgi:exodeoxyribonuclease VII large subunit